MVGHSDRVYPKRSVQSPRVGGKGEEKRVAMAVASLLAPTDQAPSKEARRP